MRIALALAAVMYVFIGSPLRAGVLFTVGEACQHGVRCERPAMEPVSRKAWGAAWPFTVDEAVIVCYRPLKAAGQMVVVDGHVFAANGTTLGMRKGTGLTLDVDGRRQVPQSFDADFPIVARLWALQPKPKDLPAGFVWDARVDWSPVTRAAQRLGCTF